jgi:NADPH2:quinone reductase
MELAGVVDAVGHQVTRFQVGDPVFGYTGIWQGAHAEYRCLPESALLVRKPTNTSFTEAAAIANGGLTALVYLRTMGRLQAGERVLIHGASGSVGTAAVQLARHLGAHVTAVCSTRNVELVRSLGAEHVIDYLREDCLRTVERYDVVFDTVTKLSWSSVRNILAPRGRYLVTHFSLVDLLRMAWTAFHHGPRMIGGASNFYWTIELLEELAELVRSGTFHAVIDKTYPLANAADAHRYVESGHKRGNVVLLTGDQGQHDS